MGAMDDPPNQNPSLPNIPSSVKHTFHLREQYLLKNLIQIFTVHRCLKYIYCKKITTIKPINIYMSQSYHL